MKSRFHFKPTLQEARMNLQEAIQLVLDANRVLGHFVVRVHT